ncbi:hypothetical protein GKD24_05540 [Lactobacillus paracasei]|nr:hypothetical protein F0640_05055 [Lacticaseibacillus paracasei]MED7644808.1 hypothetical protein [Lactiplantibacillus plantarum]PTS47611.1 hypothetical protein DBQ69_00670 [Lactobacillus sp. DS1_6]PTS51560.1 hypothetical protein DBQ62_04045 [Lactobacillus sp. DS9_6]PTS54552.1 hypothetical protein DBQ60_00605 [Lactobacillus sp. DS2_6]PTS58121.1 hypothetical protein DBQ61_04320 [Lactobacillus sp. DS22_6]PTS63370.1 hypothetical protein DBQ68_05025 [Lactobacillus sp. DS15_6]PTS71145.1 hypothe
MQTTQRRAFELMLLGDFETGLWARSAVTAFQPHLAGDCGVWHGRSRFCLTLVPNHPASNKS